MNKIETALAVAATLLTATAAQGSDKLALAPPPVWVRPIVLPQVAKADGAAVHVILQDQQVDLQPHVMTRFNESVVRVQTPQGLSAANVSIAWNPETSTATVHRLQIRRGDKLIDVLASQSFNVVRRENNLEAAMIDGILTATIQPEGVQVGDVIDFAVSITERDPALQGHVETIGAGWNGVPIDLAHFRAQWPSSVVVHTLETEGLLPLKIAHTGGLSNVELTLSNLQPITPPRGAPSRYAQRRLVELSDFRAWSDLAALMTPLYDKATQFSFKGPLQAEIAAIAAASSDPKLRAQAALALVQDRVRYVFLGMNDGGLVPADADTTWARRFGDCKGKTVLLLAMLKALGISAQAVIVSTEAGDGLDRHLPMVALFNHVLVRATIAGQTYWLDGTRQGDNDINAIKIPDFRWGLPLTPGASLVAMNQPPPNRPLVETAIRLDATGGVSLPAAMHVETIWRDDFAVAFNQRLANLAPEVRDNALKTYWRKQYEFLDPASVGAAYDPATREERFIVDGPAKMDWVDGWYEADGVGVGYKPNFDRDPGPNKDAPFAVPYPSYTQTQETVLLPPGAFRLDHGETIDETVAGIAYHRSATLKGNRFTVEETDRSIAREFPAADAAAAATTLRALADKSVFIGKPQNYRPTDKELSAAIASPPATATGLLDLANQLIDRGRYDEAIGYLNKAASLEPRNAMVFTDRAFAYQDKGDQAHAQEDVRAALAIDPDNAAANRAQGVIYESVGDLSGAITAYSRSLRSDQSDFALTHIVFLETERGHLDEALDYSKQEIARQPGSNSQIYLIRATILRYMGRDDDAIKEADIAVREAPTDAYAHVVAAQIFSKLGQTPQALKEFDRSLAIDAASYIYLDRAAIRATADFVARQTDIDLAIKADPKSVQAWYALAKLREDQHDYKGAVAALTSGLNLSPENSELLAQRGVDYVRAGEALLGNSDLAASRVHATHAGDLNALCWAKATTGVALDSALADCDAALAKAPNAAGYVDSRGFVLLRLGRLSEAQAAFDRALERVPMQATSLYGRALVEVRSGESGKADADAAAARHIDGRIDETFAGYGLALPRAPSAPSKVVSSE